MDRDEFKQWASDVERRFPDLGTHIALLPKEQRDVWFADIFEHFELRDALAVNRRVFESGEGLAKYERDKLPSLFIRLLQEQRHARTQREAETRRQRYDGAWTQVTSHDAQMGRIYRELIRRQDEYRQRTGDQTPDDVRRDWLEELWAWNLETEGVT